MAVVSSDELNFVEWGWYEQEHPSGNGWICIDTNGPSTLVTTQTNGVPWCKQTIRTFAPSTGEWWYWALSDPLLDGNWTFRYLTTDYYTKNMGTLTTGQVRLNAERKSLSDTSNHAEFLGAQRMGHDTYGNPVWRDFGTVTAVWGSDPDYHYCYYNTRIRQCRRVHPEGAVLMGSSRSGKRMAVSIAALTVMLVSGLATLGVWYVHARNVNDAAYARMVYGPVIGNLDDPNHPLLSDGRQLASPTLAAALLPFPIYRPQVSVANDSEVTQTWVNEDEAAFRYASGMRVYVKRWPAGSDPAAWYSEQKSTTGVGTVTTIGRNPAWYADANEGGPDTPKDPFVDVSIGSTDIVLSGNVQLADLLTAAANLSP